MPEKTGPADWRKADQRPAGLRRGEQELEDVWSSAASARTVSREALEEAAAIPEVREPVTAKQWAKRGALAAGLVGAVAAAFLVISGWNSRRAMQKALDRALTAVAGDAEERNLRRETVAEVHRAAGEFCLRRDKPTAAEEAQKHFWEARSQLLKADPTPERDALLIDLALAQADLGGDESDVKKGKRIPWNKAQEDVRQTLELIRLNAPKQEAGHDAIVEGLRAVARKLIVKGQAPAAAVLAIQLNPVPRRTEPPAPAPDPMDPPKELPVPQVPQVPSATLDWPESVAVVGWELLRAGQKAEAERLADYGLAFYVSPEQDPLALPPPPVAPTLVALCLSLDNKRDPPRSAPDATAGGQALAEALAGNADKARGLLEKMSKASPLRLRALVNVAAEALDGKAADTPDLDAALAQAEADARTRRFAYWPVYRLIQSAARAGAAEEKVQRLSDLLNNTPLSGRGHLEQLRARLAGAKQKADEAWLDPLKNTSAEGLAREAFARHNARYDSGTAKQVDGWEEPLRPFGHVGFALGLQDK